MAGLDGCRQSRRRPGAGGVAWLAHGAARPESTPSGLPRGLPRCPGAGASRLLVRLPRRRLLSRPRPLPGRGRVAHRCRLRRVPPSGRLQLRLPPSSRRGPDEARGTTDRRGHRTARIRTPRPCCLGGGRAAAGYLCPAVGDAAMGDRSSCRRGGHVVARGATETPPCVGQSLGTAGRSIVIGGSPAATAVPVPSLGSDNRYGLLLGRGNAVPLGRDARLRRRDHRTGLDRCVRYGLRAFPANTSACRRGSRRCPALLGSALGRGLVGLRHRRDLHLPTVQHLGPDIDRIRNRPR